MRLEERATGRETVTVWPWGPCGRGATWGHGMYDAPDGCFALLPIGRIPSLQQARALGDCLVVALHDDASMRLLKGARRPLLPHQERAHILVAFACEEGILYASLPRSLVLAPSALATTSLGLSRGDHRMWVHSARSQRIQQLLERVIVGALFVYVVCSVISISAMQTAYILALVAWAARVYLHGDTRQLRLPLLLPFGAFFLASTLATLRAVEPFESLKELRNVFEALLFYLIVNQVTTKERATTLTRVLMATGTLMALYGVSQSLTHGVHVRVQGTMDSYMTFAGLLMLVDLMTVAQLLFWTHIRQLVWGFPALLSITAALLMTQTRSAWCGLIAGCCVIFALRQKVFLLALPLIALVVLLLVPQPIKTRALSILDRRETTAQERLSMWSSGLHILRDHPWTGVGMGAMERIYPRYREPDSPINPQRRLGHLHNNVIQVVAERGLLGLACWLWIWVAYGYHTWRIYRRLGPEDPGAKALVVGSLASVIGFHTEGLFEHTFGDSEVITLTYFLMALPFVVQRARLSGQAWDS